MLYLAAIGSVVALTLSSVFEDYHWTPLGITGLALTLAGNAVMFARLPARRFSKEPV